MELSKVIWALVGLCAMPAMKARLMSMHTSATASGFLPCAVRGPVKYSQCLETPPSTFRVSLEHRCTGALFQADCCRQSRLLFRGRLRTVAGLRFPPRLRDLPLCAARTASRADPRVRGARRLQK